MMCSAMMVFADIWSTIIAEPISDMTDATSITGGSGDAVSILGSHSVDEYKF